MPPLGALEARIARIGETANQRRITPWDAAFAAGLTVACLSSFEVITLLMTDLLSRTNDLLGGMWTAVATVFVFRQAGAGVWSDSLARFVATCVSILLCFLYLLVFPFTAIGMACLIGLNVLPLALMGRRDDIVTAGITTAVVMVVAGLGPGRGWEQPLLRLLDTIVGAAIGIAGKWVVLRLFVRFAGPGGVANGRMPRARA